MRVPIVLGRAREKCLQESTQLIPRYGWTPATNFIDQGGGMRVARVGRFPVVNALESYAEHLRNVGCGPPAVEFQQGKQPAVKTGVRCRS